MSRICDIKNYRGHREHKKNPLNPLKSDVRKKTTEDT